METLIIIGAVLVALGIIGSIVPAMPGPLFSFIGLLLLYFSEGADTVPLLVLLAFGAGMIILSIIDYVAPILGAKYAGASKKGFWGAILGALVGIIFFPPLGIFLGALFGAIAGELYGGKEPQQALRAGVGVVLGSVSVIILQTIYAIAAAIYFFIKVI